MRTEIVLVLIIVAVVFGGVVQITPCAHGGGFYELRIDGESGEEAHYSVGGKYLHSADFTAKYATAAVMLTVSATYENSTIVLLQVGANAGAWIPGQLYTLNFNLTTPNPIFGSRTVPFQVDLSHTNAALEACAIYLAHVH